MGGVEGFVFVRVSARVMWWERASAQCFCFWRWRNGLDT